MVVERFQRTIGQVQAGGGQRQCRSAECVSLRIVQVAEKRKIPAVDGLQTDLIWAAVLKEELAEHRVPHITLKGGEPEAAEMLRRDGDSAAEVAWLAGEMLDDLPRS